MSMRRSPGRSPFSIASIQRDRCALSARGRQQRGLHALTGNLCVFLRRRRRLLQPAQTVIGMRFAADPGLAAVGWTSPAAPDDLIASRVAGVRWRDLSIPAQRRNLEAAARLERTIPPFIEGSNVMKVAMSAEETPSRSACRTTSTRNSTSKAVKCSCSISMARDGCARESRLARVASSADGWGSVTPAIRWRLLAEKI